MDIQAEFVRAIRAAGCLGPGDPLVLGVSGGPDSLAMLHLFRQAQDKLRLRPHVLHLNHQIRGSAAEEDAGFVAATCREWDIPCRVEQADVPALARRHHLALEEAARQARYRALAEEADRIGARVIAVAHTADDQAETILMHFLRGSGLAGLRGMLPATPLSEFHFPDEPNEGARRAQHLRTKALILLRPMLAVPRSEIAAYCAAHGLTPRADPTNLDTTYFRNRLRHEVIPLLDSLIPGLRERLTRTASVMAADDDRLERDLDSVWAEITASESPSRLRFHLAEWRGLSLSLQRRAIRRAIARLDASLRNVAFVHIEDAIRVAQAGSTGTTATLPGGLNLRVEYDALAIAPAAHPSPLPDWPLLEVGAEIAVSAPGEVALPCGWRFRLTLYSGPRSGPDWDTALADPWSAVLSVEAGALGLTPALLRSRRRGDRFLPQGAGGSQKVSEFMINAKIPAAWRDRIPLLVVGEHVAWLCGWRVDQRFAVEPSADEVWLAAFEKG